MTNGQAKRGSGSGSGKANGYRVGKQPSQLRGGEGRTLSQPKTVSGGPFSDLRVHFPEGRTNHTQEHFLRKSIPQLGGVVLERLSDDVTHVVMETLPRETNTVLFDRLRGLKASVLLVKPNWLCRCADKRVLAPPTENDVFVLEAPASSAASQPDVAAAIVADEDGSEDGDMPSFSRRRRGGFSLACQPGTPALPDIPVGEVINVDLVGELKQLVNIYEALPVPACKYKSQTFSKLAEDVATLRFLINSPAAARNAIEVLGLGLKSSRAKLLVEFGRTGTCPRLNALAEEPDIRAVSELSQVWGMSGGTACRLVCSGIKSCAELRARVESDRENGTPNATLNDSQLLGLSNLEDLRESMLRAEVEDIARIVHSELQLVCPGAEAHVAGSYRRGKGKSNDVDFLITYSDSDKARDLLEPLVERLSGCGLLTAILSQSSDTNQECKQCLALCRVREKIRRIDLKVYPPDQMPYALLYFTGSAHFNRSMRYYAKRLGWSLSDKGLRPAFGSGDDRVKGTNDINTVPARSEEDIFNALGLIYVPPEHRNV